MSSVLLESAMEICGDCFWVRTVEIGLSAWCAESRVNPQPARKCAVVWPTWAVAAVTHARCPACRIGPEIDEIIRRALALVNPTETSDLEHQLRYTKIGAHRRLLAALAAAGAETPPRVGSEK